MNNPVDNLKARLIATSVWKQLFRTWERGWPMLRGCIATLFFIALPVGGSQAAVTNCGGTVDCVPRIPSVQYVKTHDLSGDDYTSFYLVSYGDPTTGAVTPQD